MTQRAPQAGFTLIEALVAMAVLALGAVSLLTATEGHSARISALTDRTAARWTADYALALAGLGDTPEAEITMLGRRFSVGLDVQDVDGADLQSLTVSVFAPGDSSDTVLYLATGYRLAGPE